MGNYYPKIGAVKAEIYIFAPYQTRVLIPKRFRNERCKKSWRSPYFCIS